MSNRSEGNGSRSRRKSGLTQRLKDDSKARVESGKQSAAEKIEQIADAIDAAGAQLDRDQPTVGSYATRLADGLGKVANRLRDGSVGDLGRDAREMATRNPALFLLGSVAVGLILARLLRVAAEHGESGIEGEMGGTLAGATLGPQDVTTDLSTTGQPGESSSGHL